MSEPYQVFAPPRTDAPTAPVARPVAGFFWGRIKAIALWPAMLAFFSMLSFPAPSGRLFLVLWGVWAVPFAITSVLLFRVHFLPQATERPMYTSVANRPMGAADGALLLRVLWTESALGMSVLPILAVFAGLHGGWFAAFAMFVLLLIWGAALWLGWVEHRLQRADLAMRDRNPEEAVRLLEPLGAPRLPVVRRGELLYKLGIAHSWVPDVEAAVRRLGQVRGPYAGVARRAEAQLRIGLGDTALAEALLAEEPSSAAAMGTHYAIGALLDLHRGEPANVVAQREGFEAARSTVGPEMASWHDLLLAAAHARCGEPEAARALLSRSGWTHTAVSDMEAAYPEVAAAVRPVLEEEPP